MQPGSGPDLGSGSWDPPPPLPPLWPPAPPPAASTGSAVTQWVIYLLAVVLLLGVPTCVCLTARRALEKRHKRQHSRHLWQLPTPARWHSMQKRRTNAL